VPYTWGVSMSESRSKPLSCNNKGLKLSAVSDSVDKLGFLFDNNIIFFMLGYLIVLLIPYIIRSASAILNGYFVCIAFFAVIFIRYFRISFSKKAIFYTCVFFMLNIIALAIGHETATLQDLVLASMYTLNFTTFFCLMSRVAIDQGSLKNLYKGYVAIFFVLCIQNLVTNYSLILSSLGTFGSLNGRHIASVFGNRNSMGFYMFIAVALSLYLYYRSKKRKYLLCLLFFVATLVFTFSRNSLLTTACFFIVFVYQFYNGRLIQKLAIACGMCLSGVLLMLNPKINMMIVNAVIRTNDGLTGRDVAWRYYFDNLTLDKFLFGNGAGSTQTILSNIKFYSFHNSYIDILNTNGFIFLFFCICFIIYLFSVFKRIKGAYLLEGCIFSSLLIGFLIYNLFESVVPVGIGFLDLIPLIFIYATPLLFYRGCQSKETQAVIAQEEKIQNIRGVCGNERKKLRFT